MCSPFATLFPSFLFSFFEFDTCQLFAFCLSCLSTWITPNKSKTSKKPMYGGAEDELGVAADLDFLMLGADSAHKLPFEFKFQAFPADPDVPLGGYTQGFEITSSFMNGAMEAQNAVTFPSHLGSAQNQGKKENNLCR